jgi:hypothetical protein
MLSVMALCVNILYRTSAVNVKWLLEFLIWEEILEYLVAQLAFLFFVL